MISLQSIFLICPNEGEELTYRHFNISWTIQPIRRILLLFGSIFHDLSKDSFSWTVQSTADKLYDKFCSGYIFSSILKKKYIHFLVRSSGSTKRAKFCTINSRFIEGNVRIWLLQLKQDILVEKTNHITMVTDVIWITIPPLSSQAVFLYTLFRQT